MIERAVRPDEPPEPSRRRKPHARVNNNLLNRPLARDCRVRADWIFSDKYQRWWCDLPGTKYIRLRLPGDAQRRLPDAFDIAVLFLILREARMTKSRTVRFPSQTVMLRGLGLAPRARHRRRLERAIMLWSQLSIRWKEWYREAQFPRGESPYNIYGVRMPSSSGVPTRKAKQVTMVRPPPIERLRLRPLAILVAKPWLEYGKFETKVDLPLPMRAAAQNLVLALLAHPGAQRRLRSWCRTAGLNHKARNLRLPSVVSEVSRWFQQHKGETVEMMKLPGRMYVFMRLPARFVQRGHNAGPGGPQRRT